MKLVKKMEAMENRARRLSSKEVVVGWADDAKEPSEDGKPVASLATVAKTLCYGREGGKTKSGREYGRIPARNFVEVLKNKHSRLMHRITIRIAKIKAALTAKTAWILSQSMNRSKRMR
ncbi:hypothetical protein [Hallerella porci]|uniref:hypothetical protein n=1 Tax=Hallerella porci TaxID=1945871 RepID=UPI002A7EC342|nr:hypothetical protein [Hallerella porci]